MKRGLIIAIIVIVAILITALLIVPFVIILFKAKAQCGENAILIGSLNKGYYCMYTSVCKDCQNASQCSSCSKICQDKGKIERTSYCGPSKIDLTNKIKRYPNGSWYVEMGPINCYCCCNEK